MTLTQEQINQYREKYNIQPVQKEKPPVSRTGVETLRANIAKENKPTGIQELFGDVKETASSVKQNFKDAFKKSTETLSAEQRGEQGVGSSFLQTAGAFGGAVSKSIGDVLVGTGKAVSTQEQEDQLKQGLKDATNKVLQTKLSPLQNDVTVSEAILPAIEAYENFKEKNPVAAKNIEATANLAMLALDVAGAGQGAKATTKGLESVFGTTKNIGKSISNTTRKVIEPVERVTKSVIPSKTTIEGAGQGVKDVLARFPRVKQRIVERGIQSAERAERIKNSTPIIAKAIKNDLDDKIINTVVEADKPTLKAYKEIVDVAQDTSGKLGVKQRPEIIAGRAAEKQFNLIEKQRKAVGGKIGKAVDSLSTERVDMKNSYRYLDDVLKQQGITVKNGKLQFSGKFTPNERNKIEELYKLATEGGDNLSPRQIYDADSLFSKLQRESRMEGIGDIIVDTPDGQRSLFGVFRDTFSNKLDTLSPEIKQLNGEYRKVKTLINDIEKSIIKTGNFETAKSADLAEFAQTNLRRLLSDAQSAAAFREIAMLMDDFARSLGYTGAKPSDLIAFATEMRKLFPDTIPQTSATGITTNLKDVLFKALDVGKPNLNDQQKVLIDLLEDLLKNSGTKNPLLPQKTK